jgi:general secretion pathway protein G
MPSRNSGFSLLEIIVALAILTIVVGAAIPVVSVSIDRSKKEETRKELNALKTATEGYFEDVWAFPPTLNDLLQNLSGASGWVGPYLSPPLASHGSTLPVVDKDAWNADYRLTYMGISFLEIRSPGPDGSFATADDIAVEVDITPIRRQVTLNELTILNGAVQAYNRLFLELDPLQPNWTLILQKLRTQGLLPSGDATLESDGWGSPYTPDPPGQAPVVRIGSTNL